MAEDGNKQSTPTETAKLTEKDITGLKYFDQIAPLLQRLHDDTCDRDAAGNRTLFYDQYCMLMLLYFFNPIVTSLRGLQQASELKNVQAKLGCARASLGSLSEATTVFDAERLKDIIRELGQQLQPLAQDKRLQNIDHTITLVDDSLIAALPRITERHRDSNILRHDRVHADCPVDGPQADKMNV